jgi:hypothetical protein
MHPFAILAGNICTRDRLSSRPVLQKNKDINPLFDPDSKPFSKSSSGLRPRQNCSDCGEMCQLTDAFIVTTVKPHFANASDHEQFGLRTNFPNTKRLG